MVQARDLINELTKQGYIFTLKKDGRLIYEYRGQGEPDPDQVAPLLKQVRGRTEEVKRWLRAGREDPRPDLKEDSELWQAVLEAALCSSKELWGLLHGLRCMGCKLEYEGGRLVLSPRYGDPEVTDVKDKEDWQDVRERWLWPNREEIKKVFGLAEENVKGSSWIGTKRGAKVC